MLPRLDVVIKVSSQSGNTHGTISGNATNPSSCLSFESDSEPIEECEEDIIASLLQLTGQRLTEKGYHYDVPKGVRPQSVGYDLGYGNDRKKHQALQRKMHRMCDKGVIVQKEYGKYLPLEEKIDQKPMPF